jgi:hypothetical protein
VPALIRADSTSFSAADTVAIETPAADATSEIRTLLGTATPLQKRFST